MSAAVAILQIGLPTLYNYRSLSNFLTFFYSATPNVPSWSMLPRHTFTVTTRGKFSRVVHVMSSREHHTAGFIKQRFL